MFCFTVKSQNLFVNIDMAGNISHLTLSDFDSAKVVENAVAAKVRRKKTTCFPPTHRIIRPLLERSAGCRRKFTAAVESHTRLLLTFGALEWSCSSSWISVVPLPILMSLIVLRSLVPESCPISAMLKLQKRSIRFCFRSGKSAAPLLLKTDRASKTLSSIFLMFSETGQISTRDRNIEQQ